MLDYINAHQGQFWVLIGFALLALEALVLGFSSGVALFAGFGALITGGLMQLGILPETWIAGIGGVGVASAVATALLWRPLKRLQVRGEEMGRDRSSDLIGFEFVLASEIGPGLESQTRYSGVVWKVAVDPEAGVNAIAAGTRVRVTALEAGRFWVSRAGPGAE